MKRLEATHGAHFELIRHFLARTFDSEMTATRGSWGTVLVGAFALAVPAGMLFLSMGRPVSIAAAALANLTLMFALTGILALLAWQSLFPSRRDYLALAGLPVRSRQIFVARFACTAMLAGAISLTVSVGSILAGPRPLARMVATCLGSVSIFFGIVTLQGLLIQVLPPRLFARWSTSVQGLLMAAFLLGGAVGGLLFGRVGDRAGRVQAMGGSILCFSLLTGASWFARTAEEFLAQRRIAVAAVSAIVSAPATTSTNGSRTAATTSNSPS